MTKFILAALGVFALIAPAPAVALPATTAEGDIQIAEAFWDRTPTGCISVSFSTTPAPDRSGEASMPLPGEAPIPCVIAVHEVEADTGYAPQVVCLIAVHEYGHLLGEGHSPDPASVMHEGFEKANFDSVSGCIEPVTLTPEETRLAHARGRERRGRCRRIGAQPRRHQCLVNANGEEHWLLHHVEMPPL